MDIWHLNNKIRIEKRQWRFTVFMASNITTRSTRLNWETSNNILSSSNNQVNGQRPRGLLTIENSLDSDDDLRSGCRNVSQCHHKQSFSGLTRTIILHRLMIWFLSSNYLQCWVFDLNALSTNCKELLNTALRFGCQYMTHTHRQYHRGLEMWMLLAAIGVDGCAPREKKIDLRPFHKYVAGCQRLNAIL